MSWQTHGIRMRKNQCPGIAAGHIQLGAQREERGAKVSSNIKHHASQQRLDATQVMNNAASN